MVEARDPPEPARIRPPPMGGVNDGLFTLAMFVVVVAALYFAREVLIPITMAILLSFVLAPVVEMCRSLRIPRAPSVILAVLLGLTAIGALGGVIGVQVAGLATDAPRYASTIERKFETLRDATLGKITELTQRVGRQIERPASPPPPAAGAQGVPLPRAVPVEVIPPPSDPLSLALSVLQPILTPLESALIIFIVAVFILIQRDDLRDRMIRLFGSTDLHRTTVAMNEAAYRLSKYFLSQLAINTAFGIVNGLGLLLIGVPSPVLWGILAALLRFVPYVGPLIAAALPAALAAAVSPHWTMAAWTLGLFAVTEGITGQVIEPLVYGHSTGLSPAAVVIAAIFWSWLWGPIGLILSTPLTLCLVVLGRYVDRLEFLDVLLGDRPALTPVENFYQRMLADDLDDALEQAELLLKGSSLTAYYDEVVMKGLKLAANDAQRGVLDESKIELIKRTVHSLIQDLADHDDRDPHPSERDEARETSSKSEKDVQGQPAPITASESLAPAWSARAPVLCIAGRGPLDDAPASILAQLLEKHGLGSHVASHHSVSRENIHSLNVEGIAMVCVSYLDISGSPAAVHYLIRRLRRRLPQAPIVVGLWPEDDPTLRDDRAKAVLGADYYATSLGEAVEACVKAASENPPRLLAETGRLAG